MGETNSAKMLILPKTIYTFNGILIKITPAFITEFEETILKFLWKEKHPQIAKVMLKRRNYGGITLWTSSCITKL